MPPETDKKTDAETMAEILAENAKEPDDGSVGDSLDLLTDEEREALNDDDYIETDDETGEPVTLEAEADGEVEGEDEGDLDPAVEASAESAPEAPASAEVEVATPDVGRVEIPAVTITPEQMEEQVKAFKTEADDVYAKFEDGEFSSTELREALAGIEEKQNQVRDTFAAEQAQVKQVADADEKAWNDNAKKFMAANPELSSEAHLAGFDQMVRQVTRTSKPGDTYASMLDKAKQLYAVEAEIAGTPLTVKKPPEPEPVAKKVDGKPMPKPGQTLSNIPAAEVSPAGDNKYAALDELMANGTSDQIEAVMSKMSTEEAENYASSM